MPQRIIMRSYLWTPTELRDILIEYLRDRDRPAPNEDKLEGVEFNIDDKGAVLRFSEKIEEPI